MNDFDMKDVQSGAVLNGIKDPLKLPNLQNAPRVDTGCLDLVHDVSQGGIYNCIFS